MPKKKTTHHRGTAAEQLSSAALRRLSTLHTTVRRGSEWTCAFCRVSISCFDAEFEVDAMLDGDRLTVHLHSRCYDAWKAMLAPGRASEPQT